MSAPRAVAIGSSAGAVDALLTLLPALCALSLPVFIVVHLPPDKKSIMAELLQAKCRTPVREAEHGEPIQDGTLYLAPPDYHLLVEQDGTLSLSSDEPVLFSRPSIDVLFESAADAYGPGLLGLVLTGASSDGANGLRAVGAAGGTALAQDPATAYASAMPRAALEACPTARSLSLEQIGLYLHNLAPG